MKNPWMNKTLFGITKIVKLRDMTKLEMLASASMLNAQITTFSHILMNQYQKRHKVWTAVTTTASISLINKAEGISENLSR